MKCWQRMDTLTRRAGTRSRRYQTMTEPPTPPCPDPQSKGELAPERTPEVHTGPDQVVVNPLAEPSDNTPTVITRTPHRSGRPEDGFAGALRGRTLAHYELLEAVGVGGMAAVIRARDTQLDRIVALKILPPELATDPETVRRFQQEARAAARLDHENIARVFFCGEDQGLNFIAFEFVEGDNLRTILDRRGRLPVPEAVHYVLQIAIGLTHAASRAVVHRDIKPSNIIITPGGQAKLVDMGLARRLDPHPDDGLTQSGMTLGTFDYISPEQALEPREADVRSDIYSLGCTFYHLLTGQAPVPEGTAAKKLHHQQYVAPIDPRQLNPDIPDDVAAILSRMMAKEVADRYQRPEQLVQHLSHVAQKLGIAAEKAEGIAFAEPALPAPPRIRPLLVAVAAAVIVGAVIVIHTITPDTDRDPVATGLAASTLPGSPKPTTNPAPLTSTGQTQNVSQPRASNASERKQPITVHTGRELADALARNPDAKTLEIWLASMIDPSSADDSSSARMGLLIQRRSDQKVILRPALEATRAGLRWAYDAGKPSRLWSALTVDGGNVLVEGLHFEINAKAASQIQMTAISLLSGRLTLKDCEFTQEEPATASPFVGGTRADSGRLVSVAVEPRIAARLDCYGCFFRYREPPPAERDTAGLVSQEAVRLAGPVTAEFDDCGFGPHATLFHLVDNADQIKLTLQQCTALLSNTVAFQVGDGNDCPLTVSESIFAYAGDPADGMSDENAILVRTSRRGPSELYSGVDNRYFRLTAFCQQTSMDGMTSATTSWDDFKDRFTPGPGDPNSQVLDTPPWGDRDPVKELRSGRWAEALRLDINRADLREKAHPRHLVGVESCAWAPLYPAVLPLLQSAQGALHAIRVVDPTADDSPKGIYKTLNAAILYAEPGDEIRIRSNGPMKVDPIVLQKSDCDLMIRPAPGFHPLLELSAVPADASASLFRLYDGKLRLVNLEFRLNPQLRYVAPAVVTIAGSGSCTFRHCVVTLDASNPPDGADARLAAVVLAEPLAAMKMDGSPAAVADSSAEPSVEWDGCFVRGAGDMNAVRASRPATFKVSNCLLVLDGSLLTVRPFDTSKDVDMTSSMKLALTRTSAYLADSLVRLQTTKDLKDLLPLAVSASDSIFTASADGKALVHFDGEVSEEKKLRDRVKWDGSRNVCSRYENMIDQQVPGLSLMTPLPPLGMKKWIDDNGDHSDWVYKDRERVIHPDRDDDPLTAVRPAEFKVRKTGAPQDTGANLTEVAQPAVSVQSNTGLRSESGMSTTEGE